MMIDFENFFKSILSDLRVELKDEFDRNFERKAFFDVPWVHPKRTVTRGSLMARTNALRTSIKATIEGDGIIFKSSLPYAAIHNSGGEIVITDKMKRFFWAMYYKASGAIGTKKDGTASKSKRSIALTAEAEYWKSLALMKVGDKIRIPKRQFIGYHQSLDPHVERVIQENINTLEAEITTQLKSNT